MDQSLCQLLLPLLAIALAQGQLLYYHDMPKTGYTVSYDKRSFFLNGRRTLFLSGSVHYPRHMEGEWETIFNEMIKDGLNMVQTYIFWNLHEPVRGAPYDFSGNKNFLKFVEQAGKAGLFVTLRIGPFVSAEWDHGGIPHWIDEIPGMKIRSSNAAWENEMSRFFKDIVNLAKPYLADKGGPIIFSQIENEFHAHDPEYVDWCGKLVAEVNLSIPFFMCHGESAKNTVNSINGFDCAVSAVSQATKYPNQPLCWTEDQAWFQVWDEAPFSPHDNRPASEMAFVMTRWFARGGVHHNYYMWYGGNNFGRYAAGACITNMYAAGANILFDGHYHEPKKSHLQRLHETFAKYSSDLLNNPGQLFNNKTVYVLDPMSNKFVPATKQYAFVYGSSGSSGIAFIESVQESAVTVMYESHRYNMSPNSSLLIDLKTMEIVYDTSNVSTQNLPTKRVYLYNIVGASFMWEKWEEPILTDPSMDHTVSDYPLEQLNFTNDLTDYLFYETSINAVDTGGKNSSLVVQSQISNSLTVYVDEVRQSGINECDHYEKGSKNYTLSLNPIDNKEHRITILSISLGIETNAPPGYRYYRGITGKVSLGNKDLTKGQWIHRKYLQGELKNIFTVNGTDNVDWTEITDSNRPPVWYKTTFDCPTIPSGYTLLLDMKGMGRGYFFLNGINMGRYWLNMVNGEYVQRYYYIPGSVLMEKENLLVLVEDLIADHPVIQLVLSTMTI